MPAIDIPDPLPPAITSDREVIKFFIDDDLAEFGHDSLVARTWHWVLQGGGPGPISHTDWRRFDGDGPPSTATHAAEITARDELNRARYICWVCTAEPGDELPLRFHPWDAAPAPTATEEGSVTITIRENPGN